MLFTSCKHLYVGYENANSKRNVRFNIQIDIIPKAKPKDGMSLRAHRVMEYELIRIYHFAIINKMKLCSGTKEL